MVVFTDFGFLRLGCVLWDSFLPGTGLEKGVHF